MANPYQEAVHLVIRKNSNDQILAIKELCYRDLWKASDDVRISNEILITANANITDRYDVLTVIIADDN